MAVDALLRRGHLDDRVHIEHLFLLYLAIDGDGPGTGLEILGQTGGLVFVGGKFVVVVVVGDVFVGRDFFVVENGLFWMPSILALACATTDGEASSCIPTPATAAAPAIAAPARNFRRFRYRSFGVISDEWMSDVFLISMRFALCQEYA